MYGSVHLLNVHPTYGWWTAFLYAPQLGTHGLTDFKLLQWTSAVQLAWADCAPFAATENVFQSQISVVGER